MRDEQMITFYASQQSLGDTAQAYARWCSWCADNDEEAGSMPEFIGRLRRTHEAQQRHHRQGSRCPVHRR